MTTPAAAYTITRRRIPEEIIPGKRLGRHVVRDSRSAAYPYRRREGRALAAVLHARNIPILDQGNVGSCTGNAETGLLGTSPVFADLPAGYPVLDEAEALNLYSAAEVIDGSGTYPPNDNGSSGTSVMQAAKNAGLIAGYLHALTVADMINALQDMPVIVGGNWYSSFDSPDSSGLITISAGAYVRGGHEWLVRGYDPAGDEFAADNSWGEGYGVSGSFRLKSPVMERLLAEEGDCMVPVPLSQPAPVPQPVPPVPGPGPSPPLPGLPAEVVTLLTDPRTADWSHRRHVGDGRYVAGQLNAARDAVYPPPSASPDPAKGYSS